MPDPTPALKDLVESTLGTTRRWTSPDTGMSSAERFVVELESGPPVFVKAATDAQSEEWVQTEHRALEAVGSTLAPAIVAWHKHSVAGWSVLVTEGLVDGRWPASHDGVDWQPGDHDRVLAALAGVASVVAPEGLRTLQSRKVAGWEHIGKKPELVTDLGVASESWVMSALGPLVDAERALVLEGGTLVHGDVRSDNIFMATDRVAFVDWSNAAIGAADVDRAGLLPYLHLEGGAPPAELMPDGGSWAAAGAADLVGHLRRPDLPAWLRRVLVRVLAIHLDWAVVTVGLPEREGPAWEDL